MVPPSLQNRHYADSIRCTRSRRDGEQDGLLVVATPAYQTAYQSVRPGPITQVLRRTLDTLSAAVKRGRILADTEEVTGSNPVSPTKKALVSHPFATLCRRLAPRSVDLSAKTCRPIACVAIEEFVDGDAPRVMTGRSSSPDGGCIECQPLPRTEHQAQARRDSRVPSHDDVG
jgi:hypothetical protein